MPHLFDKTIVITLLISVAFHIFVVFGISFNIFDRPSNAPVNTLDITLVKQQTLAEPEEAEYLAQATNEGGGELGESSPTPTVDLPVPLAEEIPTSTPFVTAEIPPMPNTDDAVDTPPTPESDNNAVDNTPIEVNEPEVEVIEEAVTQSEPTSEPLPATEKITRQQAERIVESSDIETEALAEQAPETAQQPLSARDLMTQARTEISTLQDQMAANSKSLSERPNKRRISAATTEYAAAAYMRAWEMKIERLGNLNYPQLAREQNINGSLILSVDIRPDGSVPANGIVISRSSGYQVLDDAAIKIVRMGAPYAQIPEDVLQGSDMLTIIRTWRFESLRGLSTR